MLVEDTHKFESRYIDRLVGVLPRDVDMIRARSPVNAIDNFSCPLIQVDRNALLTAVL
eukprot:SAG31_NODE_2744_length_5150_cov_4.544249_7_plen_58_part_00